MDSTEAVINACLQRLTKMNPSENNAQELNRLIDKLSSIDYQMWVASVNAQAIQDALLLIMELMPSNTEQILSKFCQVVQSFACKSKVIMNEKFLTSMTNFFINSSQCCEISVLPNILYALSSLLYGNVGRLEQFYEQLVSPKGVLLSKASAKSDTLVQLAALKCLQSLTFRNQSDVYLTQQHLFDICTVCVSRMKSNTSEINSHIICKIILTCLKCLQHIIAPKIISTEGLGQLLGLLKAFLYCGFPGQTTVIPTCLYPTLMSLYVPQEPKPVDNNCNSNKSHFQRQKVNKNRSRRPSTRKKNKEKEEKKHEEESDGDGSFRKMFSAQCNVYSNDAADSADWWRTSSSDSDFSDVEERSSIKLKSLHTSIRQHAYCTLHAIIKAVEKKVMFGYWSSFLPDSPSVASCSQLNIFTTILKDPSPQVRLSAVSVLTDMMRGSKQFLLLVDDRTPNHTSFITASSVLTTMVNELHRCLLLALISETTPTLLTQILKCYSILADVVPYQRLKIDILQKLLKHLQSLLTHKDSQVQVACLTVYGSLLNSEQIPKEVVDQIIDYKPFHNQNIKAVSYKDDPNIALPWIMAICKECLENRSPPPLRVEALQVFRIVCGRYFSLMRPHILLVQQIILSNLQDEQPSLQLHGAKLLESIGRGILNDVNQASDELLLDDENLDIIFNFWNSILTGPFPACLSNEDQPTLCSVCCDCLSTIPPKVFARLPRKVEIFCMTMMFGLSIDADHNIRGAAVRCLGIYSLFPSLREDLSFLSDIARILTNAVEDSNVIVRAQASWAMGNLSDALFLSRDEFPGFADQVTIPFFCAIGMASVKASEDCDRIKTNAVRALGNLLHYLPSHFLDDDKIKDFIIKAEFSLLSALSAKFMKVCWNACYAFGNALRNECLAQSKLLNLEEILRKLMAMLSSVNSKVRINAILALSMLPSRQLYEDFFISICNEFIVTLSTAGSGVDFKELKHCESLCDTLCSSLCQLLLLANTEDFEAINKSTLEAGETLLTSMWKFGLRTSKDKIDILDTACQHIECLLDLKENATMTQTLELWRDILNQGKAAFYQR